MPINQRTKGKTGELEVAHMFTAQGFRARRGVSQSQDATLFPDVMLDDLPQYWVEVKRGAETRPLKALEQAMDACGKRTPIAVCRNDRAKATVTMRMSDWMTICYDPNYPQCYSQTPFAEMVTVLMPWETFIRAFLNKHSKDVKQLPLIKG